MERINRRKVLASAGTGIISVFAGCQEEVRPEDIPTGGRSSGASSSRNTAGALDPENSWDLLVQLPGTETEGTYISLYNERSNGRHRYVAEGRDLGGERVAAFEDVSAGRYVYAITSSSVGKEAPEDPIDIGYLCIPLGFDKPALYTYTGYNMGCRTRERPKRFRDPPENSSLIEEETIPDGWVDV